MAAVAIGILAIGTGGGDAGLGFLVMTTAATEEEDDDSAGFVAFRFLLFA